MPAAKRTTTKNSKPAVVPAETGEALSSSFSFDDYDNVIGFVVSQAGYQLAKALERTIIDVGSDIRPREFPILNRLHQFGELTQTQLAELTYKDKPAMTRMLDRLIERKLVKKVMAADDRRSFLVSLTPRGEAIRNAIVPRVVSTLESACIGISRKDIATTVATLRKINARL
jgi:DNA-binding MarR family transcriptional regulator